MWLFQVPLLGNNNNEKPEVRGVINKRGFSLYELNQSTSGLHYSSPPAALPTPQRGQGLALFT